MKITSKLQAFSFHLVISFLFLLALYILIRIVWFPGPLIDIGGLRGIKIIIGVDLVIGPILTLVVFKYGKPGLKLDLTIIGALQLACLAYGLLVVNYERPVAQILADDGVHLLTYADTKQHEFDLERFDTKGPKLLMLDLPEDPASWEQVKITTEFLDGIPFLYRSDLYLDLLKVSPQDFQSRVDIIQAKLNGSNKYFDSLPSREGCEWLPIHSPHFKGYVCFSNINGAIELSAR